MPRIKAASTPSRNVMMNACSISDPGRHFENELQFQYQQHSDDDAVPSISERCLIQRNYIEINKIQNYDQNGRHLEIGRGRLKVRARTVLPLQTEEIVSPLLQIPPSARIVGFPVASRDALSAASRDTPGTRPHIAARADRRRRGSPQWCCERGRNARAGAWPDCGSRSVVVAPTVRGSSACSGPQRSRSDRKHVPEACAAACVHGIAGSFAPWPRSHGSPHTAGSARYAPLQSASYRSLPAGYAPALTGRSPARPLLSPKAAPATVRRACGSYDLPRCKGRTRRAIPAWAHAGAVGGRTSGRLRGVSASPEARLARQKHTNERLWRRGLFLLLVLERHFLLGQQFLVVGRSSCYCLDNAGENEITIRAFFCSQVVLQTFQSGVEFVVGQEHDFYGLAHVGLPVLVHADVFIQFVVYRQEVFHQVMKASGGFFIGIACAWFCGLWLLRQPGILDRGEAKARKVSV